MKKISFLCLILLTNKLALVAQTKDTTKAKELAAITVETTTQRNAINRLESIAETYIFSGKKNEVISLTQTDANITDKTGRQLFAKVPGVFVYDMDGAGNQINISTRGLDPHRGWEFNIRKDGILTNSDIYAYPASHYSIPMESVERIELVRGTGSLQYGAQFGGMLNYISKQGDTTKPISLESINTVGSYNLLSSYNAIAGKINKFRYYAYLSKKTKDGYRQNEHTNYDAQGIILSYSPARNLSIRFEWARSSYLYKIPGPLIDEMFNEDPRQATRARNYFSPTINIPSFVLKWNMNENTKLQFISSALIGARNSVLFDKAATIKDTLVSTTMQYNNRQVDIDRFNSYTQELRLLHKYKLGNHYSSIATGIQLMNNDLYRTQLGKGTTGSDYDLSLVEPTWGRDIHFKTKNVALFFENSFSICNNLTINLGMRTEKGESNMTGQIVYYPTNKIPVNLTHHYTLLGTSFSYKPNNLIDVYGGFSQVYRPMIFKDIVPSSVYEIVDNNIKDASGYNIEMGCRGTLKSLKWDITGFLLQYNNRFGTIAQTDVSGSLYTYRTNIGNSLTKGIEIFIQNSWSFNKKNQLTVFTSTAFMDGKYTSGIIKSGSNNIDISNNKIESVPNIISRNGITWNNQRVSITGLYSYTSKTFADALNTQTPNASGAVGIVPSYSIIDLNASIKLSTSFEIKLGINNIANKQYFTKRPLFYPGPGIWSSDGRNFTITTIFKL